MGIRKDSKQIIRSGLLTVMNRTGVMVRNEAVLNLTGKVLKRRSGRGASSVFWRVRLDRNGGTVTVGSNVFYLRIWELTGLPNMVIVPRNKKALKIPVASAPGGFIFRKKAVIPRTPKKPWLEPAATSQLDAIKEVAADEMARTALRIFE